MNNNDWISSISEQFDSVILRWDEESLKKYSHDYHYFSPILNRELENKLADCIASPRNEEELEALISFAVKHNVPITIRGNGTGNYGQCVPLTGGMVLNLANMNRIIDVGQSYMTVEPGARMGHMESVARLHGQELKLLPSTYLTASIGGYIAGGSGGIGSITWGFVWDGMIRSMKVKTIEEKPRTIEVSGDAIKNYLHSYGTVGIISQVTIQLVPRLEWMQYAVTFKHWEEATYFSIEIAKDNRINKRLVSCHEAELAQYYKPLNLTKGRAVVLLEIAQQHEDQLQLYIEEWNGQVDLKISAEQYHQGVGVSDFSWNHGTLWSLKNMPDATYLHVMHDTEHCVAITTALKKLVKSYAIHFEFVNSNDKVIIKGLPVIPYKDEASLQATIEGMTSMGLEVINPHSWKVRENMIERQGSLWELKLDHDPHLLLNQLKLTPQ